MKINNLTVCQSMRTVMDLILFAVNAKDEDALQEINKPSKIFDYAAFLDRLVEMLFVHNKEVLAAKLLKISVENGFDVSSTMKKYFEIEDNDKSIITSFLDDYSFNSFKERKYSKLLTEVENVIFHDDPHELANISTNHIKAVAYFGLETIFNKIVELNLIPLDKTERRAILWYSLLGRNKEIINYCLKHFNENEYNILIQYIRIEILHEYELTPDVINRTIFTHKDLVNSLYFKFFMFYYKMNGRNTQVLLSISSQIPNSLEYINRFLSTISTVHCGGLLLDVTKKGNDSHFDSILNENPSPDNFPSMQIIASKLDQSGIYRIFEDMIHFDANLNVRGEDSLTPLMISCRENFTAKALMLLEKGADPNTQNKSGSTAIFYAIINENIAVIKALLKHGADATIQNSKGMTPLMYAKMKKSEKIISIIENAPSVPKPKVTKPFEEEQTRILNEITTTIEKNDYKSTKRLLQYANSMNYDVRQMIPIVVALKASNENPNNKVCLQILDSLINYTLPAPYSLVDMSIALNIPGSIEHLIKEFDIDVNMMFIPSIVQFASMGNPMISYAAQPIYSYYQKFNIRGMELTFLMIAIIYENYDIVKTLLLLKANPNLKCHGVHPLKACANQSIKKLLIEFGAK